MHLNFLQLVFQHLPIDTNILYWPHFDKRNVTDTKITKQLIRINMEQRKTRFLCVGNDVDNKM